MKAKIAFVVAVITFTAISCASRAYSRFYGVLATGSDSANEEFRRDIEVVLRDVNEGTYRVNDEVRGLAFEAISRAQLRELTPDLVRIASMPIDRNVDRHVFSDAAAVAGALDVLTDFRDENAPRLNAARITEEEIPAIPNLRRLQAWDYTKQIESEVAEPLMQWSPPAILQVLRFLGDSPQTDSAACPLLANVDRWYHSQFWCRGDDSRPLCDQIEGYSIVAAQRASCTSNTPGSAKPTGN
jgi:hypothetical protein